MNNKTNNLPKTIPVFPLSNFIFFPKTTIPLNIFEKRYLQMVDDAMKEERIIGMIQPKQTNNSSSSLYDVGCVGKISSFNETEDGRYLIVLVGISRFKILDEVKTQKLYRKCKVDYSSFTNDLADKKEEIKFTDLELVFKNLKSLFDKEGYLINWKELQKQNLDETINTLSMASPFSLEEKQILLETKSLDDRKKKLEEILNTYVLDNFGNKTIQ
jgi:Lon protease-like protein|tara:strand:+ start:6549 stop:7193 length:645 start_codon:yes stop_codon:yes gene_type:complete